MSSFGRAHRSRAQNVHAPIHESIRHRTAEENQSRRASRAAELATVRTPSKRNSLVTTFSPTKLRQSGSFKKPLKTGYLTKQGAVRKSWLRRFFVVRADYKIEYYEDEEASCGGAEGRGFRLDVHTFLSHSDLQQGRKTKRDNFAMRLHGFARLGQGSSLARSGNRRKNGQAPHRKPSKVLYSFL